MSPRPPALSRTVMRLMCDPRDRAYVLSDLDEEFAERLESGGTRSARRWYRGQVARSALPCLGRRARGGVRAALSIRSDLSAQPRHALRRLARAPVQTVVTVVSLGIGLGLATSVFAIANAFLFAPPGGIADGEGLVSVFTSDADGRAYGQTSLPDYRDMVDLDVFEGVAASRAAVLEWEEGSGRTRLIAEMVAGDYFGVLGVRIPLGRTFLPEETVVGAAEPRIVLSDHLWRERFGGDVSVLGRTVRLNGRDFVVVGVAPEGLLGRMLRLKVDGWVPVGIPGGLYHATDEELVDRADREYLVTARLREGTSIDAAQAALTSLGTGLAESHPESWRDDAGRVRALTVLPERDARVPPDAKAELVGVAVFLLGSAALILLIACANVAGLLLARSLRRQGEFAVRLALGASRGTLARSVLWEALMLAGAGGGLGLWMASLVGRRLGSIPLPIDAPIGFAVDMDLRVLAFALAASFGTALAFGIAPALQAGRADLTGAMKGSRGAVGGAGRLRGALVVVQVAVSLALLVESGLFLQAAREASEVDTGLRVEGLAVASHTVRTRAAGPDEFRTSAARLLEAVRARPEIAAAEVATTAEAGPFGSVAEAAIATVSGSDEGSITVPFNAVGAGYFALTGRSRPARGRLFDRRDVAGAPAVAVVNETLARRLFPDEDPVGRRLHVVTMRAMNAPFAAPGSEIEIVGVLPDLRLDPGRRPTSYLWVPFDQVPTETFVVHAEARGDLLAAVRAVREEVVPESYDVQLVRPRSYADLAAFSTVLHRVASRALGSAGGFALLLVVIGVYGIVSFAVTERTREMAIRRAMGARSDEVVRELAMAGLRWVLGGVVVGLAIAVPVAFLLRSELFGVSPLDPVALGGGILVMTAAALAATLVPAYRVTRTDPMRTLCDN